MATFEIRVAKGAVTTNIVFVEKDGVEVLGNTRFSNAFQCCVEHMLPDDNLRLGNQSFSQQVVVMLNVAIKGGLAELKNPLWLPEVEQTLISVTETKLAETEPPANLRRAWPPETLMHVYSYTDWDSRLCIIVVLGSLDEISARSIRFYYSNDGGEHWEQDGSGPWNDFYNKYVRIVQDYLKSCK